MSAYPLLPVRDVLPELRAALAGGPNAVLVAPPGAGKTTLVPLDLLDAPWLGGRKIVLIEPRRLAARAAARRMAEIVGEAVGETIGWRMRLDTKVSARTRIEVVTEGVFIRMILAAPDLPDVGAVIFDEFHERSLDGDFSLALALDVQGALREDLRLLVMSATLDGARVAALLGDAPVVESLGRAFPVTVSYRDRPGTQPIEDAVTEAVRAALDETTDSLLVFLPGQREIERVAERLAPLASPKLLVAPLYGVMEAAAQDVAIRPAPPGVRKIVLATSIAETSITIDGVGTVIDSGLRRLPLFEPATGLSRLETVRVSRASADQRAGRAGRTGPGRAIRLWREAEGLVAFDRPEILSSDLSGLVLDCAAWGVADPQSLDFLDPPPRPALAEAATLLTALGALDETGRLTPQGAVMRDLPLPPRLAAMVARAGAARKLAADLAVLLTERGLGGTDVDLESRLRRFRIDRGARAQAAKTLARRIAGGGGGDSRRDRGGNGDSRAGTSDSHEGSRENSRADLGGAAGGTRGSDESLSVLPVDVEPGSLLALAFPDRVAVARGARGHFVLANGRGGVVDLGSGLADAKLLVVAELQGQARDGRIHAALSVSRESLEGLFADRITEEEVVSFDAASGQVRARRVRRLGKATLAETQIKVPEGAKASAALATGIRARGLAALPFGSEGERLLLRLRFLAAAFGAPWPDLSDDSLLSTLENWLLPYLPGVTKLSGIDAGTLRTALSALVPSELQRRLEALAPSHVDVPSGSRLPIRYDAEGPVLSVRVQELFGLTEHPSIADGRLPLTLELLSPAHRPIQITRDLPGFWAGSWRDVRADLRGRYPRHSWPENPAEATATARAKPRGT
ncbi:ATP-dependent helicase HrpB [Aureimonas sp. SA4125]|uniref:ATP-dependent helicase HrpB n=1 Tax=Aureimonas sp. SA4125 TaxID=2826993 RepID=UPI001CC5E8AD|nr:ATP-dependent helicase HrpB [Aureimonas sp. SA4125]BDA86951.1 ATP-dependent helicase HrpB [Aureimonas sp. SA4125]